MLQFSLVQGWIPSPIVGMGISSGLVLIAAVYFFFNRKESKRPLHIGQPTNFKKNNTSYGSDSTYHVNDLLTPFAKQDENQLVELMMLDEENLKFLHEHPIIKQQVENVEGCFILENVLTPRSVDYLWKFQREWDIKHLHCLSCLEVLILA